MKSLIRLELRKQSKTFLALLFIITISLTLVTAGISIFVGIPNGEAFLSITVMLEAFGIPFFALLLGGGAGAALRSSERKAEEDIPVPPSKRVFAAYIASLTYLILLSTILFAASSPIRYSASLQNDFEVPLMLVVLLPLHSAAFVFSYWLSQGLLGGVVSTIVTSVPAYFLSLGDSFLSDIVPEFLISIVAIIFFPFWIFSRDLILVFSNVVPGLIASCVHLSLLIWLANRIEREKRTVLTMKIAAALVLIVALSLSVWGIFFVIPNLVVLSNELTVPPYASGKQTIVCGYINK